MRFVETSLAGAYLIEPEPMADARGFFARSYCAREFAAHGINGRPVQCNISYNTERGTLRGMHFQLPPSAETKFVRCTRGAILDIIVDLRPESSTYLQHVSVELSEDNCRALYVPERFAHGYQVLRDNTETSYLVGEFYTPGSEGGLLYDDPRLALSWPLPITRMSDKDRAWGRLEQQEQELRQRMSLTLAK